MFYPIPKKKICLRSTTPVTPTPAPTPSWYDVEQLLGQSDKGWAIPAEECYKDQLAGELFEEELSDEEEEQQQQDE